MNTALRTVTVLAGSALVAGALVGAAHATSDTVVTGSSPAASTPPATTPASTALAESLRFAREEERMARDLYAALGSFYDGARPMSRITTSEVRHSDAVGTLLSRYGVADPSAGLAAGTYAFPELQKLYDDWLTRGKTSVNEAYQVGIELEKRDIADLEKSLTAKNPADVNQVFNALLAGSRNHLAAYQRAASGQTMTGGTGRNGQGTGQGMRGPGLRGQNGQGMNGKAMNGKGMRGGDGRPGSGPCSLTAS